MSSRKEEERNEKIIRGLMKLPPNRRCINCNSMGPQYVCTTFWTFICITCSGIHREFTHRVKSVSMAKFTSQEVEALQKGGNQRAREIFLKNWDLQRQRLPDSSNAVKVREFIRNVYVDKRYAGGKAPDKPPEDIQQANDSSVNLRHHEEETRRASSYHSYSQSPPYDYQYEERRYGKQASAFTRKPGSDRGLYEGRFSSFSSPSRFSDRFQEERRSAHGGSNPRASDFSMSSPGDSFRSDIHSPNSRREAGFSSSQYQATRDNNENMQSQRTASLDSFGSFDSNSMSLKSASFVDPASEPEQSAGVHQDKQFAVFALPQPSVSGNFGGLDLFDAHFMSQTVSSGSPSVLFQSPEVPTPSVNSVQTSSVAAFPTHDSSQAFSSSLHSLLPQQPAAIVDRKPLDDGIPKNEGWATFDLPQVVASNLGVENSVVAAHPLANGNSLERFNQPLIPSTGGLQWQTLEDHKTHQLTSMPNKPQEGSHDIHVSDNAINSLSWNAFEEPTVDLPLESIQQKIIVQTPTFNQFLGGFTTDDIGQPPSFDMASYNIPLHVDGSGSLYTATSITSGVGQSHLADGKPTNPFDLPYDTDFDSSSMFLDMSSLQASLPSGQPPNSYLDGATQTWFHQEMPYVPAPQQGALGFMGAQVPNAQVMNVPAQGPVASVGGNPFA